MVLELMRAYQPACVLAAGVELDVFGLLAKHPLSGDEIARAAGADARGMAILLDALAGLKLLEKSEDRYAPAPGAIAALTEGGQGNVRAMVLHQANCLRRWTELASVVKSGELPARRASIRGREADYAAFIEAMDNLAGPAAAGVVGDLPRLSFTRLLDVGGASGSWTIAFLESYPQAKATLFDLPRVIPQAQQRLGEQGLLDRVDLVAGNFETDALPAGCDLAWVSAIVHQNSRAQNRTLFAKLAAAMPAGGRVLIRDILMDESRTMPLAGALFAVNMLVGTKAGGTFTVAELGEDLQAQGFKDVQVLRRDAGMHSVLAAVRR